MEGLDEQTKAMISARMGQMADMQEKVLDQQLEEVDKLTEDDFEVLRQERRKKMQAAFEQKRKWRFMGHGELQEVADQPEFFKAMNGESKRVVCHFYTKTNRYCPIVDEHLRNLGVTPRGRSTPAVTHHAYPGRGATRSLDPGGHADHTPCCSSLQRPV